MARYTEKECKHSEDGERLLAVSSPERPKQPRCFRQKHLSSTPTYMIDKSFGTLTTWPCTSHAT